MLSTLPAFILTLKKLFASLMKKEKHKTAQHEVQYIKCWENLNDYSIKQADKGSSLGKVKLNPMA